MSGVPVPPFPIIELFGKNAVAGVDATYPIPTPTQVDILVGAASFDDGFPPTTRLPPEQGGAYPFGQDVTGILKMLSAYCVLAQAGQLTVFNGAAAALWGGYRVGARVASAAIAGRVWTNWVDGNAHDPDVDATGWAANQVISVVTAPGSLNDVVLPGASDFAWDIDTTAGIITLTGFIAQRPGQRLYLTPSAANNLQVAANAGASVAANRVRFPAVLSPVAAIQDQTIVLEYVAGLNRWLVL